MDDTTTAGRAVWHSLGEVPADLAPTVVTVGNFDGVHLGHRRVIAEARDLAVRLGVDRVVAVTFDPHPFAVLRPEHAPPLLTTIDERATLLAAAGVDDVLVVPFSREIAGWPPERFVSEILVDRLHCAGVVVGANFRFGHRAAGDVVLLRELGHHHGFEAIGVPLDGGPQVWSSTYVRTCLATGDVEGAAEALGRPVAVRGVVTRGDQRGRTLGYPTANIAVTGTATPGDGVYAGWLRVPSEPAPLPAAISVGDNPTFAGERARRVEAYVLDRTDLELYGQPAEVVFVRRLRGMRAFASVDELLAAMAQDVTDTRAALTEGRGSAQPDS